MSAGSSASQSPRSRTGWSRAIPVVVAAAVIIAGLVIWRAVPAFGGGQSTGVLPIATLAAPDVHSLLIDPTDPDRVLFGSHAGIQESRDGGFTWQPGALQNADAMSMAASAGEPDRIFVAGHDVFLVSRDGGETWQPIAHDLPGTDIHAFAQDPVDPRRLYALVVGAGVLISADGGATWEPLPVQPPGVGGHGALATDGAVLYASTGEGLVRSSDGGASWGPPPAQPNGMVLSLAVSSASPQTLYAGTEAGLARSMDGGASWENLGPSNVPVSALAVAASDPNRILLVDNTGAVYRSDDGGASWTAER